MSNILISNESKLKHQKQRKYKVIENWELCVSNARTQEKEIVKSEFLEETQFLEMNIPTIKQIQSSSKYSTNI